MPSSELAAPSGRPQTIMLHGSVQTVTKTQISLMCTFSRVLCIHAHQLHSSKHLQSQLPMPVWTQPQNTSNKELETLQGKEPPILPTGCSVLELKSKEKLQRQRNCNDWACLKAQGRSMTWAIKEQLDLNSFLPRRTILAEETWLTKPAAASDLMTARQMYRVPSGWRRNQGCALSMKKQPPLPVFPLFPF